ncbi:MAG: glucosaminidase domain-containing protein, partial [Candidatus Fonsibacter sp.]
ILNKKIINFYKKIKEAILENGFSRYIIETIAPTFKFLSFILKNLNKIYFFMIEKINLKKLLPYTIIVSLVIFTAFVPEIFKSSAGKKKIINSQTDMYSINDPSIDQMLKKSFLTNDSKKLGLDFQQVISIINLFEKSGYNLEKVREGEPVANFFLAKFPQGISELDSIEQRKRIFIQILLPIVLSENEKIITDRRKLLTIINRKSFKKDADWLNEKFQQYKVKNNNPKELLLKMDIIPPSLAIAQAAYESGWGTSRFAIEGNALFGQWSWKENNGMIPEDRGEDEKHEISKFNQIRYAVSAYKNNLNTHPFYEEFRKERARQRAGRLSGTISGIKLIEHVHKYSIRGNDYVLGLKKIIEQNALQDFDKANLLVKKSGSI